MALKNFEAELLDLHNITNKLINVQYGSSLESKLSYFTMLLIPTVSYIH